MEQRTLSISKGYKLERTAERVGSVMDLELSHQERVERVKSLIDLSSANMPAIMGSEKFIKGMKIKFSKKKKATEVPESKKLCLEAGISKRRCRHYEIREAALSKPRRGVKNEARDLAIYLLRYVRGDGSKNGLPLSRGSGMHP